MEIASEHRQIFQQRNDADDDDDDLRDLFRAAVDRQAGDEIENQDDHQEGDQDADQCGSSQAPNSFS